MSTDVLPPDGPVATPINGVPRVDLVPPIVEQGRRNSRTIRALTYGLGALVILVGAASLGMAMMATNAEAELAQEQTRTQLLLQQQTQFNELNQVKQHLTDYEAAVPQALFAEASWTRLMTELDKVLPSGVTMTSENITVKDSKAGASNSTAGAGLDAQGVIQIDFTADAKTFDSPTPLLNALSKLTGYQSATVDAVSADSETGYVIRGVVQLGSDALGGTARVEALDADQMKELHTQFEDLATGAAQPSPSTSPSPENPGE